MSFSEAMDDWLAEVVSVAGSGSAEWVLDETDTGHEVTSWAAAWVIADWAAL